MSVAFIIKDVYAIYMKGIILYVKCAKHFFFSVKNEKWA